MNRSISRVLSAIILATTMSACQASGNLQVANPLPTIQSYLDALKSSSGPKEAVLSTSTNATVQQQAATDLTPYRSEFNATTNVWIVYYYSPSKNKSYRCEPRADKTVNVTEVTDVTLVYQAGDTININQVNIDASTAAQTAINQVNINMNASPTPSPTATPTATPTPMPSTSPVPGASPTATPTATPTPTPTPMPTATPGTVNNTTVTNVTINNVYLISPGELQKKHGRKSEHPCYVVVTNNQPIYIDASTGNTITATSDASVNVGSGSASTTTTTTTTTNP